jgi:hypothetical protein
MRQETCVAANTALSSPYARRIAPDPVDGKTWGLSINRFNDLSTGDSSNVTGTFSVQGRWVPRGPSSEPVSGGAYETNPFLSRRRAGLRNERS